MKKTTIAMLLLVGLLGLMIAEYRFIMCSIVPYRGANGTIYLEAFGIIDEYYADPIGE